MTKKEALIAVLQLSVPDITLEKAMIDKGITGSDAYTSSAEEEVDLCAIRILQGLMATPDVSEGDLSLKYDRKYIQSTLLFLAQKWKVSEILDAGKPTVTGRSPW